MRQGHASCSTPLDNAVDGDPRGAPVSQATQFVRSLKLRHLLAFGLAYLAPTAIFNFYGIATELSGGMMALAYLVTLVVMFFTAYSYAQMVKAFPVAGSAYTYVQKSVHPYLGFATGWVFLLDYMLLPMICYLLFGIYMEEYVPAIPTAIWVVLAAAFGAVMNILGAKISGRLNIAVVSAQIIFAVVLIGLIVNYVLQGSGAGGLFVPEALYNAATFNFGNVMWAASILAVSFLGFDAVSTLAEETHEPTVTIPRAILIMCVGAGLGFATIAYFLQIAWPNGYAEFEDPDTGIFELLPRIGGEALNITFFVADQAASILCAIAAVAAVSRVLYGMGRDGLLPKRFFGKLSPRFGTPVNNIVLVSVAAMGAVFFTDNLLGATSLTSFGAITGFIMVNIAVINHYFVRLRRRSGTDVIRYLVLPLIGVATNVALWVSIDSSAKMLGVTWLIIGVIYLGFTTKGFRRLPAQIRSEDEVGDDEGTRSLEVPSADRS
ncbi:Putrescine importer PuuP [Pseudoclavibacter sp. AY1F1]|nr:Putrescine importer PuuP [Pseudoclavibacter sp. AY1F1]